MQNTYLSVQPSSLSIFMIWKTHIVSQKPRERQPNAKVCGSESAIFLILTSLQLSFKQRSLENGSSAHHFSTKLMLNYHSAELYNHSVSS